MEEPLLQPVPEAPDQLRIQRPDNLHLRVRLNELLENYQNNQRRRRGCCRCCSNPTPALSRCAASTKFFITFVASAAAAAAPSALATTEALSMVLLYFLAMPNALFIHSTWSDYCYEFSRSMEDVVAVGLFRSATTWTFYLSLPPSLFQRCYYMLAVLLAVIFVPFSAVKTAAVAHNGWTSKRERAPAIALCSLSIAFSILHVSAALGVIAWRRRRQRLFGDEEEERGGRGISVEYGKMMMHRGATVQEQLIEEQERTAVGQLTDAESRFFSVGCTGSSTTTDVAVHYKVAMPSSSSRQQQKNDKNKFEEEGSSIGSTGVILIHPFGGGVHSWRLVMQHLADRTAASVAAFDRPGFGLSSRPTASTAASGEQEEFSSPFSPDYHALLAVKLAQHLGFEHVVFAGAGDGALIALLAAELARKEISTSSSAAAVATLVENHVPNQTGGGDGDGGDVTLLKHTLAMSDSLPSSPELRWMGSAARTGRRELLRQLLRGDTSQLTDATTAGSFGTTTTPTTTPIGASSSSSSSAASTATTATAVEFPPAQQHLEVDLEMGEEHGLDEPLVMPRVAGVVLLHPDVSGQIGPLHIRVLGASKLGRHVLKDLLAAEIGDVGRSGAWVRPGGGGGTPGGPPYHDEVLELYRKRLHVGPRWDAALVEVCRAGRKKQGQREIVLLLEGALGRRGGVVDVDDAVPSLLVVHGAQDSFVRVDKLRALVARVPLGQLETLQQCGPLSYEEQPEMLVDAVLSRFVRQVLQAKM